MFRRTLLPLLALVAASFASAEIRYSVLPMADKNRIRVTMQFEAGPGPVDLKMPNWAPGAYVLSVPARGVEGLRVLDRESNPVAVEKPNDNTWRFSAAAKGRFSVEYTAAASFSNGAMHYSGPSAYLYVSGRKEEACRLAFSLISTWNIAIGLDPIRGSKTEYSAPDYDVLADNPVTLGDFIELRYEVLGKPHFIAIRGVAKDRADRDAFLRLCKHTSQSQADFFGGLPYRRYVWHLNITGGGGGGGLEHLTSTAISCGPTPTTGIVELFAHEYFHLWNVKRIRSKPLGPFDYDALPKTGALYWLEGTTDYYASLLPFRYGLTTESDFFQGIVQNTFTVRANPARLEVSPFESGMRVGEANNGRGNSNGWRISYYNLGWLVGLLLDIEIRSQTQNKRSLDDVMKALWIQCKDNKPGFEEDEIRRLCIRFGGEALGPFFDRVVMKPGEMPIEDQLAKVGLRLGEESESYVDPGFTVAPVFQSQLVRVSQVRGVEGLQVDDVVLAIGGTEIKGTGIGELMGAANRALGSLKTGDASTVKVRRAGEEKTIPFTAKAATRTRLKVTVDVGAGEAKKKLREGWYYAGRKLLSN